ncbi:hypothetical protein [Paraburkholderia phenoliruptrix]|uniref:hypothetical protein n=1 Tax=Paraburkholderia phenoliruptrix TaxID=252970 RepID=UPI002865E289|nr:hypothetical protein [Paraburkholderia phenoliruptrix]MDR6393062.1 hypothetical protein [Paraburkholderia phenoliruptrix]
MMNPMIASLSPDDQQSLLQLQQRQAIGQALLQQGLTPIDTSNRQVGGMGYRISPLEGLAKLANMYAGNKISMDAMGKQAQLMGQMYGNAFGANQQPASDVGGAQPAVSSGAPSGQVLGAAMGGGAPAPQTQMSNGVLTLPGYTPQQSMVLYGMLGQDAYGKMLAQQLAPTAATLAARQGGFDPMLANQAQFRKDTYVAPLTGTGIMRDPFTKQPVAYNPDLPANSTPLFDASGNVAGVNAINGAQAVTQGNAAASAAGSAQFKPVQVYNPETHQMEYSNEVAVTNPSAPAPLRNNNPGALMPGGKLAKYPDMQSGIAAMDQNLASYAGKGVNTLSDVIAKWAPPNENNTQAYIKDVSQRLGIPPNQKVDLTNPAQRLAISSAIMLHENGSASVFSGAPARTSSAPAAAPPLGAQTTAEAGARNQQDELSKKWTDLNAQNQQAQGVISNLQNIKTLAAKAAVGPQSDRLNYVNGLLSLAGSEKATDAVTANDLLNKYSNQITARLSGGGMGTDAARAILQSAYPNAHMTPQAINEAADNLQGASQMIQAKTRLLAPLRNAGDAAGYTNTELKFDQNADPRIFQYANIRDPAQRQAFARQLMQQDPKIVDKIKALQGMGAL